MKKIINDNKGNALLITILIMGVIITITAGINALIVREIGENVDYINSGRAYYAAQSASESALFDLAASGPGYEKVEKVYFDAEDDDYFYEYSIQNLTNSIPIVDPAEVEDEGAIKTYTALELNQSVQIPLFISDESGNVVDKIDDFKVSFYLGTEQNIPVEYLTGYDVLRWKVYGTDPVTGATEAIDDYLPASISADVPNVFGTSEGIITGKYVQKSEDGTNIYFRNEYNQLTGEVEGGYLIRDFITKHDKNYLIITNQTNPNAILGHEGNPEFSKIYYKIESDQEIPRQMSLVFADGYYQSYKQSLDINYQEGSYLPVFNFALYRTDMEKIEE